MKLLLTGFEPWNSHINPSWEAVKLTPDSVEGIKIEKPRIRTKGCAATEGEDACHSPRRRYMYGPGRA